MNLQGALLFAVLVFQVGCSRVPSSWFANIRDEPSSQSPGSSDGPPPPAGPSLKLNSASGSTLTPTFEFTGLGAGDKVILLRGSDASCTPGTVVGQAVARTGALSPQIQSINNSGSGTAVQFRARIERSSGEILCTEPVSYTLPSGSLSQNAPYYIPTLTDAVSVASGASSNCALLRAGTVSCWGSHDFGGLGNGSPLSSGAQIDINQIPVPVTGLPQVNQISSWGYFGFLALTQAGDIYWWGQNPSSGAISTTPVLMAKFLDIIQMDKGLLLRVNGEVSPVDDPSTVIATGVSWFRSNDSGSTPITFHESGGLQGLTFDESSGSFSSPGNISTSGQVLDALLGSSHACTLTGSSPQTSQVQCYGDNGFGQLGNGSTQDSGTPVSVALTGAKQLFGGVQSNYAINQNDDTYFWGRNTLQTAPTPVLIPWLNNVIRMDAQTMGRACAVQSAGTVICWRGFTFTLNVQ